MARNKRTPTIIASGCAPKFKRATSNDDERPNKRRKTVPKEADRRSTVIDKSLEDTPAGNALTSYAQQPAPTLLGIPAELRLNVAEHAIQNHIEMILVESKSRDSEKLCDILQRIMHITSPQDLSGTERDTWCRSVKMVRFGILEDRYIFSPQVPAFTQLNHVLREEGREAYLKFARSKLADTPKQHCNGARTYEMMERSYEVARHTRDNQELHKMPVTVSEESVLKQWKDMQRYGVKMVKRTLRWYVLRQGCNLLEL